MTTDHPVPPTTRTRVRVRVDGTVQGVGFRPYVHTLANELGLTGFVGNDARGVFLEVEGDHARVTRFLDRLPAQAPPLARIERTVSDRLEPRGGVGFHIVASDGAGGRAAWVSPDVATCGDCRRELCDPADRRHRHPFVNCTNCGPRYTIVRDVPYDRPTTTMADFALCDDCAREYHDPADRRFHAQPVCCPACGPGLRLLDGSGRQLGGEPVATAAAWLRRGAIVAVKGVGGYHLAVVAGDPDAATRLRERKHREDKPFAVMVADLPAARRLCEVDGDEAALLTGPARPIVLLRRRSSAPVADAVAPGNRRLGVLLPYSPLHHLLLAAVGAPLVCTSGNVSDEPICFRDDEALERLAGIADAFLLHDRAVHTRVDDSVARVDDGRATLLRRSRGYVPAPVSLQRPVPHHVLGLGAELKSTVCVAKEHHAVVSQHIGDLENYETYRSFVETVEHLERLFDVRPEVLAHDLHPEYLSTKYAVEVAEATGVRLEGVQHHHAHIASCLVDNGASGPVIGLALDGLGLGTDGTVWGGEVLVADLEGFTRVGHLDTVPMPGGERAIREPWRMAAAHLDAAFAGASPAHLALVRRHAERFDDVVAVARSGVGSPTTSSAGRLFDAIAALVGIRDAITHEGQAAIELEQRANPRERGAYPAALAGTEPFRLPSGTLVRAVVEDLDRGTAVATIAARFHNTMAELLRQACRRVRETTGLTTVALSGGVFQNALLVARTRTALECDGFDVLTHARVPPNDGGISLGQVAVAGARDRRR